MAMTMTRSVVPESSTASRLASRGRVARIARILCVWGELRGLWDYGLVGGWVVGSIGRQEGWPGGSVCA